jgi:hypothetical protein
MERLELVKEKLVAKVSALAFSGPTLLAGPLLCPPLLSTNDKLVPPLYMHTASITRT